MKVQDKDINITHKKDCEKSITKIRTNGTLRFINKVIRLNFFLFYIFLNISYPQIPKNNFVHFSGKNGFPCNRVYAFLQDHYGYIWIGTNNGLVRYDGYSFKQYTANIEDSSSIQISIVCSLYEDKNCDIWVGGTRGFAKYIRNKDSFINYILSDLPKDSSIGAWSTVRAISEDKKGNILLGFGSPHELLGGNTQGGLFYYDKNTNVIKKYEFNNNVHTNSVITNIMTSNHELWYGGFGGLFLLKQEKHKVISYHPENLPGEFDFPVASIAKGKNGLLWIGTYNHGLYSFNAENGSFIKQSISDDLVINDLVLDNENNIWLATDKGLMYFNHQTGFIHKFIPDKNDPLSINSTNILSLTRDFAGSIWIGCFIKGLNRYDQVGGGFKSFINDPNKINCFGPGWARNFAEDSNQKILIGLGEGSTFINYFDPQKNSFIKIPSPGGLGVTAMYKDKQNKIWIGTAGGNCLYNWRDDRKGFIETPGFPKMYRCKVFCFCEDSHNNLWFGSDDGLWLFHKYSHKLECFKIDSSNNYIQKINEDKDQNLWIATTFGLIKFNPQTKKNVLRIVNNKYSAQSIVNNDIGSLYIDKSGIIWTGSWQGGLNKYNQLTGEIKIYTIKNGLPSNSIMGIIGDEQNGSLWLSTFMGLSRFDIKNEKFYNYDIKDGVHSNQFAGGATLKTSNGEFLFGGANGFTMFRPEDIKESTVAPRVILTNFKLSNESILPEPNGPLTKPIYDTKKIILTHDQNDITIEYTGIHFVNAQATHYAYMLENYEKGWRYVGNQRQAIYPNLPPGEYTFRIKAVNYNGVWSKEKSILIIISPPWWKNTWAFICYGLVFIMAVYSVRRYELNRINLKNQVKLDQVKIKEKEETDRMKSRFFANISHEFRTPLTLILGPLEKITPESPSEDIQKQTGVIKRNAKRLLSLINQLLDLSKLEAGKLELQASSGNIVSFIKGITMSFESLAKRKNILLKVKSGKEEIKVYFDREKMTNIVTNLLSNAFKFTPEGGLITVSITEITDRLIQMKIKDTGIGISEEELPKLFDRFYQVDSSQTHEHAGSGLGLALTKELVELHKGSIEVNSKLGEGSEFIIELPLGRAHLTDEEIIETKEIENPEFVIDNEEHIPSTRDEMGKKLSFNGEKDIILIVEDNKDVREYIKNSLIEIYHVEEAVNGEQGVIKAGQIIPDLIISDIMMPKMDGNELTRRIKNDERTSHIPVILLTAKAEQQSKLEGLETGADDYLIKPFDSKELRIRIKNLIDIRRKLQERYRQGDYIWRQDRKKLSSLDEQFMSKVKEVIEKHLSEEDFSIETFNKEVGMGRVQNYRKLKALTGCSPSRYIRRVRLLKAREMIKEKKGNISEIAYSVGFSSSAYFTRCFREEFGYIPKDLIK